MKTNKKEKLQRGFYIFQNTKVKDIRDKNTKTPQIKEYVPYGE